MPQCAVRRLRVAAASEPAARRFVTSLEDALRCATLPGDDRRVVVVRRLALGRVAHDAGTQGLGLLIEQRIARGEIAWAGADEPPDARADAVGFAGALEARVHLARRLVRGAPCDAWYWPLAVAEYRRELAPRDALRRVAFAVAALPEARVALPEWVAQVVRAGGAADLRLAIDEAAGRTLLQLAGIASIARQHIPAIRPRHAADPVEFTDTWSDARVSGVETTPQPAGWLGAVLARDRDRVRLAAAVDMTANRPVRRDVGAAIDVASLVPNATPPAPREMPSASTPTPPDVFTQESGASAPPPVPASTAPGPLPRRMPSSTPAIDADPDWLPTACGGLLFLLPVLKRAGLVRGDSPDDDRDAALRVLRSALRRVRGLPDDAAWMLVEELATLAPSDEREAQARARRDLAMARRWLHRHARLGLVTLVRRPARIASTATHIDVRFPLAGADVRVRRAGLDLDPGWLPWFGRVIAFQFSGRQP